MNKSVCESRLWSESAFEVVQLVLYIGGESWREKLCMHVCV
jgi:hypothetical protein